MDPCLDEESNGRAIPIDPRVENSKDLVQELLRSLKREERIIIDGYQMNTMEDSPEAIVQIIVGHDVIWRLCGSHSGATGLKAEGDTLRAGNTPDKLNVLWEEHTELAGGVV